MGEEVKKVKFDKRKTFSLSRKKGSNRQNEEESDLKKYMIELLILKFNRRY